MTVRGVIDEQRVQPLLAEFREKAELLGVTVVRAGSVGDAAQVLANWVLSGESRAVVATTELLERALNLEALLEAAGIKVNPSASPVETRDTPFGLSLACLAIAETGSLLLCEPSLADRSVGMLSLAHAIICPTTALAPSLADAAPELRRLALQPGGSFTTLVTGPSRTADIERVLTVGVQGPGAVLALFVDEL